MKIYRRNHHSWILRCKRILLIYNFPGFGSPHEGFILTTFVYRQDLVPTYVRGSKMIDHARLSFRRRALPIAHAQHQNPALILDLPL